MSIPGQLPDAILFMAGTHLNGIGQLLYWYCTRSQKNSCRRLVVLQELTGCEVVESTDSRAQIFKVDFPDSKLVMKLLIKIVVPLIILGVSFVGARTIIANKPEPRSRPSFALVQSVDATRLKRSDYQVIVRSQGSVRPTRESSIVPEVTGIIRRVSPNFVVGGYFSAGEVLVEIDRRDYEIALSQMNASYAQANALLQEELARSGQAKQDWKSLGRQGQPSALTARVPQVAAARASLAAAKAKIEQAELDLERTQIIAPYDGRVLVKNIDEGEFVSRGALLGRIYSMASADVRLPLSSRQLTHLSIPGAGAIEPAAVTLRASVGGQASSWNGSLVRSEGVDAASQQLYVVAQVADPFGQTSSDAGMQIGQFVTAEIEGNLIKDVFVVPRSAIREKAELLIVDEESRLQKRNVTITWSDDEYAAVSEGLEDGDILTLTALGAVTNGTQVKATIDGEKPPAGQRGDTALPKDADQQDRMAKLKAMVDKGEALPEPVKKRLQQRVKDGEKLPIWLLEAIK